MALLWPGVQGAQTLVPPDLEVAHIPFDRGGAYPGVFLFTGVCRLVRPVRQLPSGCLELLGTLEQVYLNIRCCIILSRI